MRCLATFEADDGTVIDVTAEVIVNEAGELVASDFRDLAGNPVILPPGTEFRVFPEKMA